MHEADTEGAVAPRQGLLFLHERFRGRFRCLNTWENDEDLSSFFQRRLKKVFNFVAILLLPQVRANPPSSFGCLPHRGHVQIGIQGQPHGAGNGGGCHDEQVSLLLVLQNLLPLGDSKFVLFINHDEAHRLGWLLHMQ